jgi:Ca2+-binding RTX toxin-like protein
MATIIGTEEDDDLTGTSERDLLQGLDGNDVLRGEELRDRLEGGGGDDILYGRGGTDQLYGGAGEDYLDGGVGADIMRGGSQRDTYVVDDIGDRIIEYGGSFDTVISKISYTLAEDAKIERVQLSGNADLDLTGNSEMNYMFGNAGSNHMVGGGGDDRLYGFLLSDDPERPSGNDLIEGGEGDDYLLSGWGHSTLIGGVGADTYQVYGNVTIIEQADEGWYDNVWIEDWNPNAGPPVIDLQGEIESIHYEGTGGITLHLSDVDNYVYVHGYEESAWIYGYGGDDNIGFHSNNDVAREGVIDAGDGNDRLELDDTGIATAYGGAGNDAFFFEAYEFFDDFVSVADFHADEDFIQLGFFRDLPPGQDVLGAEYFHSGSGATAVAQDADDRVIFDQASGMLYYDRDGSGTDYDLEYIAHLNVVGGTLDHTDFTVWS